MTTAPIAITGNPASAPAARRMAQLTGGLLVLEGLLIFAPMVILGGSINWPASLSEPAEVMLPLLHAQLGPARAGYFIYLIYSILFFPVALLTARAVAGNGGDGPLLRLAVGFAALSTLARCLGIIRWLVAMPALAALYVDPAATPEVREAVRVAYTALNAYGGSVGEVLGVNMFAALWLGLLSAAILRGGGLPRWLGLFGIAAALSLLAAAVEVFGIDIGALIIATTTGIQLWFLAAGITILRRPANP
ncbi:MAG: hypothetical protein OHK0022_21290 [Roseiflexaceae bacterium]